MNLRTLKSLANTRGRVELSRWMWTLNRWVAPLGVVVVMSMLGLSCGGEVVTEDEPGEISEEIVSSEIVTSSDDLAEANVTDQVTDSLNDGPPSTTLIPNTSGLADAKALLYDAAEDDADNFASPPMVECYNCEVNTFEDYGFNEPVDPSEDPLSTFALDVDTASYSVARNYLNGGQLPPTKAIRVEEFVNYFDGGYERIPNAFGISLDAAPNPFSSSRNVLLRVGVQAPDTFSETVTPDTVVLVMDRSGSMGETAGYGDQSQARYLLAHESAELLLSGLPSESRVGVIAYSTNASVIVEPMDIADNVDQIMQKIRQEVVPTDTTNVQAGLVYGYDMALKETEAGRTVLILLLSDGVANVGASNTDTILESIGERGNISLSTVGVGLGPFNDTLMEQLANKANGTYYYIDTAREAERIFVDNLTSLMAQAARDAKVQVKFTPSVVSSYRLLGFENRDIPDDDFRDNTRDAGEVGVAQSSTALYELVLKESPEPDTVIAAVTLRYKKPASQDFTEDTASFTVSDITESFSETSAHFRLAVVAATFAEILRKSPYAQDVSMEQLLSEAQAVAENLSEDTDTDVTELANLIETAVHLKLEDLIND